jgi:hypothetical protein
MPRLDVGGELIAVDDVTTVVGTPHLDVLAIVMLVIHFVACGEASDSTVFGAQHRAVIALHHFVQVAFLCWSHDLSTFPFARLSTHKLFVVFNIFQIEELMTTFGTFDFATLTVIFDMLRHAFRWD